MKALLLIAALIACDNDVGVIDIDDTGGAADTTGSEEGPGGEGGGEPGEMPEPESCSVDEDCEESCPRDAEECVCYEEICSVACESDDDCPDTPDGQSVACDTDIGICEPPPPPE